MNRVLKSMVGLLLGWGVCVSVAAPAFAGYGNHAERATENIQTRVAIAKITLLAEAAERQAIADNLFAKQ